MKPAYQINADSNDVTGIISRNFHSLELFDGRGLESDTLTLIITDPKGDIAWPQRDVILSVSIGYMGKKLIYKGKFVADEVEHKGGGGQVDHFVIRARAADMMP
jgi:phage protein D